VGTDERARLEALRELGLLDTPPEERFDRVVRLAKRLFDVPTVAVNLIDDDRLFTKSRRRSRTWSRRPSRPGSRGSWSTSAA
jgi:hypothetical protein